MRQRLDTLGIGGVSEGYLLHTLSSSPSMPISDPDLLQAIHDLKPVVFLDTLSRFNTASDENSASETAQGLARNIFTLVQAGAPAVVGLHHSVKTLRDLKTDPTLELTLRGSGDLAAMADYVLCLRATDLKKFIAEVSCVKARDAEPVERFVICGRPSLDETGALKLLSPPATCSDELHATRAEQVAKLIADNQELSCRDIAEKLNVSRNRVSDLARRKGWIQTKNGWRHQEISDM
jgi:hypothetical protein